jgi:hypothetical protein
MERIFSCKCRKSANHTLGNLRIYELLLEGSQKVLNEDLNLFMVSKALAV